MKISMDGKGRYRDNIFVERLRRTVKYEEVYLKAYANASEARRELGAYFRFYNDQRPRPETPSGLGLPDTCRRVPWGRERPGGGIQGHGRSTGTGLGIIGRSSGTLA